MIGGLKKFLKEDRTLVGAILNTDKYWNAKGITQSTFLE